MGNRRSEERTEMGDMVKELERLADGYECTYKDAAGEIKRLRAEVKLYEIGIDALRAEVAAAYRAGAEAMRERAAKVFDNHTYPDRHNVGSMIRALPLEEV